MSFQHTSTNWFFPVNCYSVWDSFTICWGFSFTALFEVALSISRPSDSSTSELVAWKRLFWSSLPSWKSQRQEDAAQVGLVLVLSSPGPCSNTLSWQMSQKFRASKWPHIPCSFWKERHLCLHVEMETGPQWLLASTVRMEMKVLVWKYNVWAVEDNGPSGGRNYISLVKVGNG